MNEAVYSAVIAGRETTSSDMAILHSCNRVHQLAPVPRPPGIACFIIWAAHVDDGRDKGYTMLKFPERGGDLRAYYKANPDSVERPGTVITRPGYATETDVECELAAVISVGGKDVSEERARAGMSATRSSTTLAIARSSCAK